MVRVPRVLRVLVRRPGPWLPSSRASSTCLVFRPSSRASVTCLVLLLLLLLLLLGLGLVQL